MKNKDTCYNDPRCIMYSGLMVDDIIMDYIKRTQSSHDCVFTQIDTDMIYIYRCWNMNFSINGHIALGLIYIQRKELMSLMTINLLICLKLFA